MTESHFQLLGLPERFAVDSALLDQRYRQLQSEVHPDRFAAGSDSEKLRSMQLATQVNEAYRTLKQPLARARYLLQRQGIDTAEESNTAMPADFLMMQMEWREAIDDAEAANDSAALDRLLATVRAADAHMLAELQQLIDERAQYEAAAATVRKLGFIERTRQDIMQRLAGLEE